MSNNSSDDNDSGNKRPQNNLVFTGVSGNPKGKPKGSKNKRGEN